MAKPIEHYGRYRIRPTDHTGKRLSLTFDSKAEAKMALHRILLRTGEIKGGSRTKDDAFWINPKDKPSKRPFSELAQYWMENRARLKRSRKDDESILRCHLLPHFGKLAVCQIGIPEVDNFISTKGTLNVKTVHNHLTLLISMLNVAKDLGWIDLIPKIKKPRVQLLSTEFSYLKDEVEIERLLTASRSESPVAFPMYATAIYAGLRAGELAGLKWEDIDLERRLIHVQRSYLGPTKSGKNRHVPILDILLPILCEWRKTNPGPFVFPNEHGRMLGPSARIFQEVFHRVLDRGAFPMIEKNGKKRRYIVFHDLRHTFASFWTLKGGTREKLQRILGHSCSLMTDRYTHLAPEAYRSDWNLF